MSNQDKKLILSGICKYFRLGSKGNRYKLIIDDIEISDWIKQQIQESVDKHKISSEVSILSVNDIIRKEKIEIKFMD
jgi:hypothetical protein